MEVAAPASLRSCAQHLFLRICLIFHHIRFPFIMFRMSSCRACLSRCPSLPPYLIRLTFFQYFSFPTLLLPPQYILDTVFLGFCGSPSPSFASLSRLPYFLRIPPFTIFPFLLSALFPDLCFLPYCSPYVLHFPFCMRIEYPGRLC
jgi:hypothetical protein